MSGNTLILREYQIAHRGETWNAAERIVSRTELALIDRFQRNSGKTMFEVNYRGLKATNWVGMLGLNCRCIEVIPKIDTANDNATRENLHYMISRAGLIPVTPADLAHMSKAGKPLLIAYMEIFVDQLAKEWRRGPIRRYVYQEDNRPYLKGKLLLQYQLRNNYIHKERFYTACDEFTEDNSISRLLKAALGKCREQTFSSAVAAKARSLLPEFDSVIDVYPPFINFQAIKLDRQTIRFEPLVNLAKLILNEISPSPGQDGNKVYSLMFDMNEVFERFIANELTSALRGSEYSMRYQVNGKTLLEKEGKGKFNLIPDMGIYLDNKLVCLIDTKWKRLDLTRSHAHVSQADMYQMYAYGKEYKSPRTILLYPRLDNLPEVIANYKHHTEIDDGDLPYEIIVASIDISKPMHLHANRKNLMSALKSLTIGNYL